MLRHDDVAHEEKMVAIANVAQVSNEDLSSLRSSEMREAMVTTKREEMEITLTVVALEI